jgi:hypothetical protein
VLLGVVVYHWILVVFTMDRHNCVLLDGIVAINVCYSLISLETITSVGDDC